MPYPASDKPLKRTTLNLYEEDIAIGEKLFGRGWSTELRNLWSAHLRNMTPGPRKPTVGDLPNE